MTEFKCLVIQAEEEERNSKKEGMQISDGLLVGVPVKLAPSVGNVFNNFQVDPEDSLNLSLHFHNNAFLLP